MLPQHLRNWLARLAPIYPGEGPAVMLCLAVNFLVVAGIMFGRNSRDALFLTHFGAQYLPHMYFASAVFLVVCSIAYSSLVDRIERGKFLAGISLLFVSTLIISWLVLFSHRRWFYPLLYMQAQVIWYTTLMQFWTFVGDLFDTRQAKRVYPLLALGALLGMVSVGLISTPLVRVVGAENLLVLWAGLIFVATALAGIVYRRYRKPAGSGKAAPSAVSAPAKISEWQKIKGGLAEVGGDPLLRSMAAYVLLLWTVFSVVDFCFKATVRARYPNAAVLAGFLGVFIGIQGFMCLVVQLFLTRPVIARLGVGTTINFHPGFLVLGTAWASTQYGFASIFTAKLGDATMLYTFSDSSYQLLYNPVALEKRAQVRGFIEGYIRPLSLAVAGILILICNTLLRPLHVWGKEISTLQQLSWGAFALAVVWLGSASTAKDGYLRALLRNLHAGTPALRLAAAHALGRLRDPASLGELSQILRSEDPEKIVSAVLVLESIGTADAVEGLTGLLVHPDPVVRATAVSALGRLGAKAPLDRLTPLLADPDARVRANVVEALAATGGPSMAERLQALFADPSLRVRISAHLAAAILSGGVPDPQLIPIVSKLAYADPKSRITAAYALGELRAPESEGLLDRLLRDPDLNVRCAAATALGKVGSRNAISPLIEALASPHELRHAARRSLASVVARCGATCTKEAIQATLNADRPMIRSELADVLGRLDDPQVIPALITLLRDPAWRVQWKVLKSFERRARAGPLAENVRAALFQYAEEELAAFRRSLQSTATLVAKPQDDTERVLSLALEDDRAGIEERVFHMLGILCGREQMDAIFKQLTSGEARQKADALEALDNLAPKAIARQVLDVLEPPPLPATGAPALPAGPLLDALAKHPKAWLRACAAYFLSAHFTGDSLPLLKSLATDRERVVRETALYSGWRAFPSDWQQVENEALAASDPALPRAAQRIEAAKSNGSNEAQPGRIPAMLTVEKVLLLKLSSLFSGLDSEELAALADIALEKNFQAGEIILEEGQAAHHLYVVASGKVEVFHRVDSKEYMLAVLGEKECFGEMGLLADEPRSASVKALEPTLVLKIDRDSFRELITERPPIAFAIFKILCRRLRQSNLEIEHVGTLDAGRHFG